jgi:hypothetical protein
MKKMVKEFYEKQIGYTKFFEKKKKISFDTSDKFVEIIDKLAKLTSNSKTIIINALMGDGMVPFFKRLEDTWRGYLKEYGTKLKGHEKEKGVFEESMKKTLENLKKLKEEYDIG